MALSDAVAYAVAHWTLDESSGTRADSVGSNDLTDNNTVGSAAGKFSNAALFDDAVPEYLSHASNSTLSVTDQDFAIVAWVNIDASQSQTFPRVVTKRSANNSCDYDLHYDTTAGFGFTFEIRNVSATSAKVAWGATSTASAWHLVVAQHDAANNLVMISVDGGTSQTSATGGIIPGGTGEFRIAELQQVSRPFGGIVDDVVLIKDRILSSAEITELWNSGTGVAFADWGAGGGGTAVPVFAHHYRTLARV